MYIARKSNPRNATGGHGSRQLSAGGPVKEWVMKSSAFTAVLVLVCAGLTFAFPFVVERITVGSWFPEVSAATETTPNAKIFHVYDTGVNTPILSVSPCVAYRVFQVELHTASA